MAEGEEPKKRTVDGMTVIPSTSDNFLRAWLEIMRPLHNLTSKEMDYAAVLLKKRYRIAQEVTDQGMIDKLLFDEEVREDIRKEAGVSPSHAKAILYSMKRKKVIIGKKVNPMYIPVWTKGEPFRWMFLFKNEDK